ncbi:hypothetical protein AHF37_08996 [Paragonimus kellicotti]|nr:hypothetical protein AHF37_08996 [Paragonimus kellicotti]
MAFCFYSLMGVSKFPLLVPLWEPYHAFGGFAMEQNMFVENFWLWSSIKVRLQTFSHAVINTLEGTCCNQSSQTSS